MAQPPQEAPTQECAAMIADLCFIMMEQIHGHTRRRGDMYGGAVRVLQLSANMLRLMSPPEALASTVKSSAIAAETNPIPGLKRKRLEPWDDSLRQFAKEIVQLFLETGVETLAQRIDGYAQPDPTYLNRLYDNLCTLHACCVKSKVYTSGQETGVLRLQDLIRPVLPAQEEDTDTDSE